MKLFSKNPKITEADRQLILKCLKACEGERYRISDENEFHAFTGFDKSEAQKLTNNWSDFDLNNKDVLAILNGVLICLSVVHENMEDGVPYPIPEIYPVKPEQWAKDIGATGQEIDKVAEKLRTN